MRYTPQASSPDHEGNITRQQSVYRKIKGLIITGAIGFGEKLSETSLAKAFQVSRTPIREAIFRLAQEGLIVKKENSNFFVRRPSEEEIEEICAIRISLTNPLVDKLLMHINDEVIAELQDNIKLSKQFLENDDNEKLNYALSEFHHILDRASHSPILLRIHESLADQMLLGRSATLALVGFRRVLIADHEKLVEAIKERNKLVCRKIMKSHINIHKKQLLEILLRDRLSEAMKAREGLAYRRE